MPLFLIGFSRINEKVAADLEAQLRASGGTKLWDSTWLVDIDQRPEDAFPILLWTEACFALPANASGGFYALGRICSTEARTLFSERLTPDLIEPRDGEKTALARYIGSGAAWFEPIMKRFRAERNRSSAATRLCHIMAEEGSDKSLGWHNYTPFYADLFKTLDAPVSAIFELGIGTNDVTAPSNMGVHGRPGASLRGWRRYFPGALVYGADVDPNVMFEEDRIKTFIVDQTEPDSFDSMWSNLPELKVDIFIDDGLHTFDAAKTTIQRCLSKVRSGGYYIIEDVLLNEKDKYFEFISSLELGGLEIELLHVTNKFDNCLIVLRAS